MGYAAVTHALAGLIKALNSEIGALEKQVTTLFDDHPDAEIYRSQPGIAAPCSAGGCSKSSATTPPATSATTIAPARRSGRIDHLRAVTAARPSSLRP